MRGKSLTTRGGLHQAVNKSRKLHAEQTAQTRLMELMRKTQVELDKKESHVHAETLLNNLEKWAKEPSEYYRVLPSSLFYYLPEPSNTFNGLSSVPTWMNEVITSQEILKQYPASIVGLRAEIQSWVATPTAREKALKDFELAVKWQKEHLAYLKEAQLNHSRRHQAWELYHLLAKNNFDNKSKPRIVAIQKAEAELKRLQAMYEAYQLGAPFVLGPAFEGIKSYHENFLIEDKTKEYILKNAIAHNLDLAKRYSKAWLDCKFNDTAKDSAKKLKYVNSLNEETAELTARYLLHEQAAGSYNKKKWLHDDVQLEMRQIIDSHLAGDGVDVLKEAAETHYNAFGSTLTSAASLQDALNTAAHLAHAPLYFKAGYGRTINDNLPKIEHVYALPVEPKAIEDLLKLHPETQCELYTTRFEFPAAEGKTRGAYGWQTRVDATLRMQDEQGVYHTLRFISSLGESRKRDKDIAAKEISEQSDLSLVTDTSLNNVTMLTNKSPANFTYSGTTSYVSPEKIEAKWERTRTEQQLAILQTYPVKKIKEIKEILPPDKCPHTNTDWEHVSMLQRGLLERRHCLDCKHPRLEVRWLHQSPTHKSVFDATSANSYRLSLNTKDRVQEITISDYLHAVNAYLLASGSRQEPYESLQDLLANQ